MQPVYVKHFIPHTPPALMIDKIIDYDDDAKKATLEFTVDANSPFVSTNGELAPESFLEIIAQSTAAQHGFNLKRNGSDEEKGFLVGIRHFKVYGKAFSGDKLTISIECGTEIESINAVNGEIFMSDKKIASAGITVWHGKK